MINLQLDQNDDEIQRQLLEAFADELNQIFSSAVNSIRETIKKNTIDLFATSKEAVALINGPLKEHFGLYSGTEVGIVKKIIDTLADSVEVQLLPFKVNGNDINGGLLIYAIVDDFSDILSLPEASVKTKKGEDLPWLHWLLIEGDRIIIENYRIAFGPFAQYGSRSGGAFMFESNGKTWRVPPEYSGTSDNNWITRVIFDAGETYIKMIGEVIEIEIEKRL